MKDRYNYTCTYCGQPGDNRDHTTPAKFAQASKNFDDCEVVISCAECNHLLGDKILIGVKERAIYLADRLRTRHKSTLNTPHWTTEELSELGPNMKAYVEAGIRDKELLLIRLEHVDYVGKHTIALKGVKEA